MSLATLFYLLCVVAAYRFGVFNSERPGVTWTWCRDTSRWLWKWLQS